MSFMNKIPKVVSFGLAIGGSILTVTGAALLGVGCQYSSTIKYDDGVNIFKLGIGVGSSNWGKVSFAELRTETEVKNITGEEFTKLNNSIQENIIKPLGGTYNEFVENSKKQYDNLTKTPGGKDNLLYDTYWAVGMGYNLMISGAVLFSVFAVVMIFGIVASVFAFKKR